MCVALCLKAWDDANERAKELVAASQGKVVPLYSSSNHLSLLFRLNHLVYRLLSDPPF